MGQGGALTPEGHRERAGEHEKVGRVLLESGLDWGGVCLFYAAHHHVRAALLQDPIFDSFEACQKRHPSLLPDDRHSTWHQARRGSGAATGWGVNDLTLLLYRAAFKPYKALHVVSNDVRYGSGAKASTDDVVELFDTFEALRAQGVLNSGESGADESGLS